MLLMTPVGLLSKLSISIVSKSAFANFSWSDAAICYIDHNSIRKIINIK